MRVVRRRAIIPLLVALSTWGRACGYRAEARRYAGEDRCPRFSHADTAGWQRVAISAGSLRMSLPQEFASYEDPASTILRYAVGGEAWRWGTREIGYVHASRRNTHLPVDLLMPDEACRLAVPGWVAFYTIEDGEDDVLIMGWFRRRGDDTWVLIHGKSPRAEDVGLFRQVLHTVALPE